MLNGALIFLHWGSTFLSRNSQQHLITIFLANGGDGAGGPKQWFPLHGLIGKLFGGYPWTSSESTSTSSLQEFAEIVVFLGGQLHIPCCYTSMFSPWLHVRYDLFWTPYYASPTNQIMLQYTLNWGWNPSKHVWCLLTSLFEVNQRQWWKPLPPTSKDK